MLCQKVLGRFRGIELSSDTPPWKVACSLNWQLRFHSRQLHQSKRPSCLKKLHCDRYSGDMYLFSWRPLLFPSTLSVTSLCLWMVWGSVVSWGISDYQFLFSHLSDAWSQHWETFYSPQDCLLLRCVTIFFWTGSLLWIRNLEVPFTDLLKRFEGLLNRRDCSGQMYCSRSITIYYSLEV